MASAGQDSDEILMTRIQRGDDKAFATLVRRHTGLFFGAAYRMCGNIQEAEDCVQNAFIKLWEKPQGWNAEKGVKFTTWFYRVVTNQAIDQTRKRKPQVNADVLDYMPDGQDSVLQSLEDRQERQSLEKAIQSLPERQKTALNLCFYEGLSNQEAADTMSIGIKALESLLMRAKAGMREKLIPGHAGPKTNDEERRRNHA